jgi:hypothetical protein
VRSQRLLFVEFFGKGDRSLGRLEKEMVCEERSRDFLSTASGSQGFLLPFAFHPHFGNKSTKRQST